VKYIFISYIIPCYNIHDYLPKCLDSLSKQKINTDVEVEFVLVNDGSPDNCLEIIRDFAAKDSRAVVVDQKNQGVSAARNAGLKVAKGEYVFFLDGDDYLTVDASLILYDVCKEHNGDIIINNAYIVKDGNWDCKKNWNPCSNMSDGNYTVEDFVKRVNALPVSFKTYRRELLTANNVLYDEDLKVGEVYTFFLHALQYSKTIVVSDKRIMNYVKRDNGVMRESNLERDWTIFRTIDKMNEYASISQLDLKQYLSYNVSFYGIVRMFSLNKYVRQSPYTEEIGHMLKAIDGVESYRNVLKFIATKGKFGKSKLYAWGQLVLPTCLYYYVLRKLVRLKG